MTDILKGKTVAVFGAYGLVGSAIVAAAVAQGAQVIAIGRDAAKLSALKDANGGDILTVTADIDLDARSAQLLEAGHTVDAVMVPLGGDLAMADFADTKASSVMGAMQGKLGVQMVAVQSVLPNLTDDAAIVMFSGLLSRKPFAGLSAMSAVNGAVEAMTRAMALELAPRRINCISPAMIKTAADPGNDNSATAPEEVAGLVLGVIGLNVSGSIFDIPRDPALV